MMNIQEAFTVAFIGGMVCAILLFEGWIAAAAAIPLIIGIVVGPQVDRLAG